MLVYSYSVMCMLCHFVKRCLEGIEYERDKKHMVHLNICLKKESLWWSMVTTINGERKGLNCFSTNTFPLILLLNAVSKSQERV